MDIIPLFDKIQSQSLADSIRDRTIYTEFIETNTLLPDEHQVEVRLIVLSQVYKVSIPAKHANKETIANILTNLWSTFLAHYNDGLK